MARQGGSARNRVPLDPGAAVRQRHRGTAYRACNRLRVEAAIRGILVLAVAVGAHLERRHGRAFAVVRQRADDREARPALGAVDERIAVAPVAGVEQLAHALVAGGDISRPERLALAAGARVDPELALAQWRERQRCKRLDVRLRRGLRTQRLSEVLDGTRKAFDLDHDAVAVVRYEACERVLSGNAMDERPESDALHQSGYVDAPPLRRPRCDRPSHAGCVASPPAAGVAGGAPPGAGPATCSSAPATCSSAPLISCRTGPIGCVCLSIARTPNVTSPSVEEIRRSVAAMAIR